MKKWLVILLILIVLLVGCIYIFIPGKLSITKIALINCSINGTNRYLSDADKWKMWWPLYNNNPIALRNADSFFINKNCAYQLTQKFYNSIEVSIKYGEEASIKSRINIIPLVADTVALQWNYNITSSLNPLKRIEQYNKAFKTKSNMGEVLGSLKLFLENKENVYGIHIDQIKVKDTLLVATRYSSNTYPTTNEIYNLIKGLKEYISKEGATETNYPMLHVMQDSGRFKTMVAFPINKLITTNDNFLLKRMVPGKILITQVKGGINTANQAIKLIEQYMDDYHLTSPAIPFQSLVTDRSKEVDTTKWVTKIYYPVM